MKQQHRNPQFLTLFFVATLVGATPTLRASTDGYAGSDATRSASTPTEMRPHHPPGMGMGPGKGMCAAMESGQGSAGMAAGRGCGAAMGSGMGSGMGPGAGAGMAHGMMHGMRGGPRVQLEHQAQQEVSNDLASISLFAEYRDKEASAASQRAAIATQQAMARLPGDATLTDRRSNLQTWNEYGPDGKVTGWRARAEIVIEGKDFAALSKMAARLSPEFAYSGVTYRLSHEARQREEQVLMARAIAAWREKAQTVVGALGYSGGFDAVDVAVKTSSDTGMGGPQMRSAPMLMASSADNAPAAALEGGRSKVTVTVSGSVRPKIRD